MDDQSKKQVPNELKDKLWEKKDNDIQKTDHFINDNGMLKEKLHKYQTFFKGFNDPIMIFDYEGNIVDFNIAATRVYGYSSEEFLKLKIFDLQRKENNEEVFMQMVAAANEGIIFETYHFRKDDSVIYVEVNSMVEVIGDKKVLYSIIRDITDHKKSEEKLRDNELMYRTMFDYAEAAVLVYFEDRWVDCNKKALDVFGCTREQIVGEHPINFSPLKQPDGRLSDEETLKKINLAFTVEPQFFEWVHCRADGTLFPAEVVMNRLDVEDKSFIQMIVLDITKRKEADERLKVEKANADAIFESSPVGMIIIDEAIQIVMANAAAILLSGGTLSNVLNERPGNALNCVHSANHPNGCGYASECLLCPVRNSIKELFANNGSLKGAEITMQLLRNGKPQKVWLETSAEIVMINGRKHLCVSLTDITERINSKEKIAKLNNDLQTLSDRMVLATSASKLGVWDWNIESNELVWDAGMYNLYNTQHEEFGGTYEAWMSHIHPDDLKQNVIAIQEALQGVKDYSTEFRIVWPDNSTRYICASGRVFFDANGKPLRMVGINRDITENKIMETALYESLVETQRILTNLQDAYFQVNQTGHFIIVNPNAARMFGYDTAEEMLGKAASGFYADPNEEAKLLSLLEEKAEIRDYICQCIRKDGTLFWVSISVQNVKDKDEKITGSEGIVRDITERIQAENAIKLETERYHALIESTNDWIWIVDSENNELTLFNTAVENYFRKNHNVDLKPGMIREEFLSEDKQKLWKEYYRKAINEGGFSIEYQTDMDNLHFLLSLAPLIIDDAIVGISVFAKDITNETLYKVQLERSNKMLSLKLQQSINAISKIGELRDVYTAGHQKKVTELSCAIAREMNLSDEVINNISLGALIHDIGKIYIGSDILNKPGKISNLEYQLLQTHAEYGYEIVKEIDFPIEIITMIHQHHERLDGTGYPKGLKGDQITMESRIVAVSDVVDAMSSHRPYRPALGIDVALEEISNYRGIRYDSDVVDACIKLFREKGFNFSQ